MFTICKGSKQKSFFYFLNKRHHMSLRCSKEINGKAMISGKSWICELYREQNIVRLYTHDSTLFSGPDFCIQRIFSWTAEEWRLLIHLGFATFTATPPVSSVFSNRLKKCFKYFTEAAVNCDGRTLHRIHCCIGLKCMIAKSSQAIVDFLNTHIE